MQYMQLQLEKIFFSSGHRTFLKVVRVLSHKASLDKCQRIGIMFSDHKAIELKVNNDKNKTPDT